MALHMQIQTSYGGSYTDVDLVAYKIARVVYRASYTAPASLTFIAYAAQYTMPLGIRNFIRFWDDAGTTPDGSAQSSSNPLFEGFIEDVQPTDSQYVTVTAFDPTYETSRCVQVMSLPYPAPVGSNPPVEQTGSYPRLVFNATIDNDDDYAYTWAFNQSVAQLLWFVFYFTYQPLAYYNAANTGGTNTAFYPQDLWGTGGTGWGGGTGSGTGSGGLTGLVGLDYVPQEKEVFESESVRSAVDRLLRYAPQYKLLWYPGTRYWRIRNIQNSPYYTLTLNQKQYQGTGSGSANVNGGPVVLSFDLRRSLDNRYTAVHFYGPETSVYTEAKVSDGSLTQYASSTKLQNTGSSCCDVFGINKWQISDTNKRFVARVLPNFYYVQVGDYSVVATKSATLQAYWGSSSDGNLMAGWRAISGWILDGFNGIITTGNRYVYRYNPNPSGGQPNYENPVDVKFAYGLPSNPLQVRVPSSGFSGTAYSVANLQNELRIYDDMLAVGYEYNNPVTSAARIAQYQALASYELAMRQDIIYAGGAFLDGLQYQFCRLNARVNITGLDGSGNQITTGWENIGAYLTDVEIDFDQQMTHLGFSSDHMELLGLDLETEKAKLRIRALQQVEYLSITSQTTIHNQHPMGTFKPQGFDQNPTTIETTYNIKHGFGYVDPISGTIDDKRSVRNAPYTNWRDYDYGARRYDPAAVVAGTLPMGAQLSVGEGGYGIAGQLGAGGVFGVGAEGPGVMPGMYAGGGMAGVMAGAAGNPGAFNVSGGWGGAGLNGGYTIPFMPFAFQQIDVGGNGAGMGAGAGMVAGAGGNGVNMGNQNLTPAGIRAAANQPNANPGLAGMGGDPFGVLGGN